MTIIETVVARSGESPAELYVKARVAGVEISHASDWPCRTFDGVPEPGCQLGVFRTVGWAIFYKDERRWEARARTDCGPVDLATLISGVLGLNEQHGRKPGHATRQRMFNHTVSARTEKRVAYTLICYKLGLEDLLGSQVAEKVDIDWTVSLLLA